MIMRLKEMERKERQSHENDIENGRESENNGNGKRGMMQKATSRAH